MYVIDMCIPGHVGWGNIESVDTGKYLGIIITSSMTWNTHITNVTSNIESVDTGKYLGVIIQSNMTWNTHMVFSCIY
jgi:hypothetical protein